MSGRMAVLLTLAVIAVILLALPAREYLAARSEIGTAEHRHAAQKQRVDELQHDVDQWKDDEHVRQQARERLNYVLPGEVGYEVIVPEAPDNQLTERELVAEPPSGPWYDRLWRSVRVADTGSTR